MIKITLKYIAPALLMLSLGNAQAAAVNFNITGDVIFGSATYGLADGTTITATGTFDDSLLTAGGGVVDFSTASGNTLTITAGSVTFFASNDIDFDTVDGPYIEFDNFTVFDFDFLTFADTNGAAEDFSSFFNTFDGAGGLYGDWTTVEITAVPVPAAAWLFGSGLLGLVGLARRRTA